MAFSTSKRNGEGSYDNYGSPSSGKSFFGKTMKIDGEITSDEDLTVEGEVTGKLDISKTLTIGNEGHVNGEISAAVVRISGEAEGQLVASEKLEIDAHGKYSGNIKAERIVVAEGAQMKGTVNVKDEQETRPVDAISTQVVETGETTEDQDEVIEGEIVEEETVEEEQEEKEEEEEVEEKEEEEKESSEKKDK